MTAPVPATDPRIDARAREIAKTKPGWPAWEHLACRASEYRASRRTTPATTPSSPHRTPGALQAGLGEPEDVSTPHERVCYSDECAEPCRSYQVRLRAELAEYKALAEKTGRRLGRARQDLSSLQREIREVAASQSYRAALLGMHPSHEVIGSLAAQERQDADRLHALGTCDLTGADS